MSGTKVVVAAGGVVWRKAPGKGAVEVLLVHRPRYQDWTFPKGKSDPGEIIHVTARREIEEETGLTVRLGHPLPEVTYRIRGGVKHVHYWCARVVPGGDASFEANDEIDEIRWMSPRRAAKALTYDHDLAVLERFEDLVARKAHKSRTLVVLRHAKAMSRSDFGETGGSDLERPLADRGRDQAAALVPVLKAFGITRVVSSPATRCIDTVEPFVQRRGLALLVDERLAEGVPAGQVERAVTAAVSTKAPTVVCSHRPTIPDVYAAVGVTGPELSPAQALVVHHRRGKVLATELV